MCNIIKVRSTLDRFEPGQNSTRSDELPACADRMRRMSHPATATHEMVWQSRKFHRDERSFGSLRSAHDGAALRGRASQ